jgi:hypothetical protein
MFINIFMLYRTKRIFFCDKYALVKSDVYLLLRYLSLEKKAIKECDYKTLNSYFVFLK